MDDVTGMRLAIEKCREGIAAGQSPFGAVIALADEVLAVVHNTVLRDRDPSAHAEINALRVACRARGIDLSGCVLYSTCEPCPMCLAASHWARITRVVYGASIADAAAAGFSELQVPAAELARLGGSRIEVVRGPLVDDCRRLFDEWRRGPAARPY